MDQNTLGPRPHADKGPSETYEMWEDHSSARHTTKRTRAPPGAEGERPTCGGIYS